MGLDKGKNQCKTEDVNIKLLLAGWGFPGRAGVKGIARLIGVGQKKRISPLVSERESFEREVKEQFLKLKEKGLGIPIFTL